MVVYLGQKFASQPSDTSVKHYWLYVLKLVQGKYYIGITTKSPETRMMEHAHEFMGARWTRKYKPVSLFDKKDLGLMTHAEAEYQEDRVVRMYIAK